MKTIGFILEKKQNFKSSVSKKKNRLKKNRNKKLKRKFRKLSRKLSKKEKLKLQNKPNKKTSTLKTKKRSHSPKTILINFTKIKKDN